MTPVRCFVLAVGVVVLAGGACRKLCTAMTLDLDRLDASSRTSGPKPPRVLPRTLARSA